MKQLEMFESAPQNPETYLEGVKLLLARMDTNPEEFSASEGKWSNLLRAILYTDDAVDQGLSADERNAIREKYKEIVRTNFTSRVLRTLSMQDTDTNQYSKVPALTRARDKMEKMLTDSFADAHKTHYPL
jgi:hypothetical protein